MRICHFTATGVDHAYFRSMASGLSSHGHNVALGTLGEYPEPDWVADLPRVDYFTAGATRRRGYPMATARLALELRRRRIELCHAHLFYGGLVGVSAARLARTPVVVLGRHH